MRFADRKEAGFRLADKLILQPKVVSLDRENLVVLSIPRGGVVISDVVASVLGCAHDVLIVKKIGFPGHEELAIGAIAENGMVALNHEIIAWYDLTPDEVQTSIANARNKVEYYVRTFRHGKALNVVDKTVILLDDGAATGETLKAAIHWLRGKEHRAQQIIAAVPVCSPHTMSELAVLTDEMICLHIPQDFLAVGQFYQDFKPVTDEEVLNILSTQRNRTLLDVDRV
jgi:putative phosphoribosyl transferase